MTGSLPLHTTSHRTPIKDTAAPAAQARGHTVDDPASARMATSETRAEMIPIRERDRTRAARITMARKSQNTTETSPVRETSLRNVPALPEVFLDRRYVQRKARTMTKGRIISKKPAK